MNANDERNDLKKLLARLPNAPVASNFTARVLEAVEFEEKKSARTRPWIWNWRSIFPRVAVAAAVLIFAGVSIERYETQSHRVEFAKNLAAVAAQSPGVDALNNFEAIQRMSQSAHADGELLAALQ